MPECIPLDPHNILELTWLPPTCGYRIVADGGDLQWWHPLVSGDPETVHIAGISVRGKVRSESLFEVEDYQDYVVTWPDEFPAVDSPEKPLALDGTNFANPPPPKSGP